MTYARFYVCLPDWEIVALVFAEYTVHIVKKPVGHNLCGAPAALFRGLEQQLDGTGKTFL